MLLEERERHQGAPPHSIVLLGLCRDGRRGHLHRAAQLRHVRDAALRVAASNHLGRNPTHRKHGQAVERRVASRVCSCGGTKAQGHSGARSCAGGRVVAIALQAEEIAQEEVARLVICQALAILRIEAPYGDEQRLNLIGQEDARGNRGKRRDGRHVAERRTEAANRFIAAQQQERRNDAKY